VSRRAATAHDPIRALGKKLKPAKLSAFEAQLQPEIEKVRAELEKIATSGAPVLVGPFTSEVGFELLYWIPMLRWAVHEFPELRSRLIVISRGGVEHWLHGLEARYVDLFAVSTPDELLNRRESLKQREVTAFEEDIYDRVRKTLGVTDTVILHPRILFNLYYRVLKFERHGFARSVRVSDGAVVGLAARFAGLPPVEDLGELAGVLPDDFVAVRFYGRPSLPEDETNRYFVERLISGLTRERPVVLLNNGLELDDHADIEAGASDRVIRLAGHMRPENNLAIQTAVLSRARAFVGTYGGLSYLAPFLGVPSLAFSSHPEHTHPWHTELAQRVFAGAGLGSLVVMRPDDLELVDLVLRGLR
jgi:hypothetical protein